MNIKNPLAELVVNALNRFSHNVLLRSKNESWQGEQLTIKIHHYCQWLHEIEAHTILIVSPPSPETIALIYAIIISNKTYIPIHRTSSPALIKNYVEKYQIDLCVIDDAFTNQWSHVDKQMLPLSHKPPFLYWYPLRQGKTSSLLPGILFHTSGTQSLPKPVFYHYHTLFNYLSWCLQEFSLTQNDQVLFTTELSFVASLRPLFLPNLSGSPTVFVNNNKLFPDIAKLLPLVTVLNITPTFFKLIIQELKNTHCLPKFPSIRLILLSGEPIDSILINQWLTTINPKTVFYNLYGATEFLVPFYKKITKLLLLEDERHLGQLRTGCDYHLEPYSSQSYELFITGEIAATYGDNAQRNEQQYLIIGDRRFIKSNDLVTMKQRELFYNSRTQRLIKRYGQLVSLDQITYILKQWRNTLDVVVLADDDKQNQIYLVIKGPSDKTLVEQIKSLLKKQLPSYMLPSEYYFSATLPLLASGKIDYQTLKKQYKRPWSTSIADYFQRFFPDQCIDFDAKIISLGLESIDYIEMTETLYKLTGKWLNVSKINDNTRINTLSSCFINIHANDYGYDNAVKLNALQQAFYLLELNNPGERIRQKHYLTTYYCLQSAIDLTKLTQAIQDTLRNHFLLNAQLTEQNDSYFFVPAPEQSNFTLRRSFFFPNKILKQLAVSVHDNRLINIYIQKRRKDYFLIITYHHILLDGWSLALLREELFRRYHGDPIEQTLNKQEEIAALNIANQMTITNDNLHEVKALLTKIELHHYKPLTAFFSGKLKKQYLCMTITKEKIEQFAYKNNLQGLSYSTLFAYLLFKIITDTAQLKALYFHTSLSNRNLPAPQIHKLITNLATNLPLFIDGTKREIRELAMQIEKDLSFYFKCMDYQSVVSISALATEILGRPLLLSNEKNSHPIVFTYINHLHEGGNIQNRYINWSKSHHTINAKRDGSLSFRIYNNDEFFIIQLDAIINEKHFNQLVEYLRKEIDE